MRFWPGEHGRRWLVRSAVVGAWAVGVVLAIQSGWDPGFWGEAMHPWPYPVRAVLFQIAKMTFLCLAMYDVLRPRPEGSALARTLRGFAVLLVTLVWEGLYTMTDQPGYAYVTAAYILVLIRMLCIVLVAQLAWRALRFHRRRDAA